MRCNCTICVARCKLTHLVHHSRVTPHLAKAAGSGSRADATDTLLVKQSVEAGHDKNVAVTYLERIAGGKATLYLMGLDLSYRPPSGFAAASMDVRAFKLACRTAANLQSKAKQRLQHVYAADL